MSHRKPVGWGSGEGGSGGGRGLGWLGMLAWVLVGWSGIWLSGGSVAGAAELRFPPPDFESGYVMPTTQYPAARAQVLEWLDVVVLLGTLGAATAFVYLKRSRKAVVGLSIFSLLYFGFYREGCVCAIGSVQNVALAVFGSGYALPIGVGVFFAAPLLVALFAGRTFCAGVCPHGALQDLVLVKPVRVPRWLESGLAVLPFLYLGAGITFAATGASFLICRFDPFVPIFRMSGSAGMLLTGGALLALGMFVGRPYCRFLCPYGALLKVASALSRWRVRVTPDVCTQCRLCPDACPYGIIREPDAGLVRPRDVAAARRRVIVALVVSPLLVVVGAGAGWVFGGSAARLHPTVALVEDYGIVLERGMPESPGQAERVAYERVERQARELLPRAEDLRGRFRQAGLWFGIWCGVALAVKWVSLGMARRREDFEPDRTACVACARCFESCPQERIRRGWVMAPEAVTPHPALGAAHPVPSAKSGGCGCGTGGGNA